MNFVHDGLKLCVLLVVAVYGVDGVVEVLDVLRVHLEEGGELDDDVADAPVLFTKSPLGHSLAELLKQKY